MDGDFSTRHTCQPCSPAWEKYDIMIGSRYVSGGGTRAGPGRVVSRSVNLLVDS